MSRGLLLAVRYYDGRYHGTGPWPPTPARLFQALVAGAAHGGSVPPAEQEALAWLERLAPPEIAAPPARTGQNYSNYVPNNDLDAKGGDPDRVAEVRAPKRTRPHLFDAEMPLLYLWHFEGGDEEAKCIVSLADRLYQLGRGVDMAWAQAEVLDVEAAESRLAGHGGAILRPAKGNGTLLTCPTSGSLQSLITRHKAAGGRLRTTPNGRRTQQLFTQPPKPRFAEVVYDSPPERRLFELRDLAGKAGFRAWPLRHTVDLVERVRDLAAARLRRAYEMSGQPSRAASVNPVFIGRGAMEADKQARIRIVPLPSIGHPHAETSIRRLLLEIPPGCPLPRNDAEWAFSGLHLGTDPETGEVVDESQPVLVGADDWSMPRHYGVALEEKIPSRIWRTITPAALPEHAARRRIDPTRIGQEAKGAPERLDEEARARSAVRAALRHAGIEPVPVEIAVQREPFHARGSRAETFAPGTRFSKHRLWHVQIVFSEPVAGPVIIGDGRYLGLGLMAPASTTPSLHVFGTADPLAARDIEALARALRRAVMARARDALGRGPNESLPLFFSGHDRNGAPARASEHQHLFCGVEVGASARLLIVAPHRIMRRSPRRFEVAHLRTLDVALSGFTRLVAGEAGAHDLVRLPEPLAGDPLIGPARTWESRTAYRPTRHAGRGKDPAAAVVRDVIAECERRGLPRPEVELLELIAGPRGGNLAARVRLRFAVAITGPVLLGRDSHTGGGLFTAADERFDADG